MTRKRTRQFESDQLHQENVKWDIPHKVMAGVAQLVRASVCGTECRQFESGHPPHKIQTRKNAGFNFIW